MLGAIIGDIVGSKYEFNNTLDYDFEMFAEGSDFTDDSICTVAVADAILNNKTYKDSLLEWCRRYPSPKGSYGGRFSMWIHSDNPQPYNSFGNGSAMRVSPVAWLFDDLEKVIEEAAETAAPTHNHPEGIKGAMAVAHAIWHFRKGGADGGKGDLQGFMELANGSYPDFDNRDYQKGMFDETCMEVVPLSFHLLAHATSFEDAIRLAISHGGDSDTIGAIVGSMAEARFGIPIEIKEKVMNYLPDDMMAVYQQCEEKLKTKPKDSILKRTYINDFHRKNTLGALKEVQIMKQHPCSREQKITQINSLHQNGVSREANNVKSTKK